MQLQIFSAGFLRDLRVRRKCLQQTYLYRRVYTTQRYSTLRLAFSG